MRRLALVLAWLVPLLVMDAGVAQAAGSVREPLVLEDFVFDGAASRWPRHLERPVLAPRCSIAPIRTARLVRHAIGMRMR
jgi:hypothetical protein